MRIAYWAALAGVTLAAGCGGGGDDDVNNNADRYDGDEAEVAQAVDDFANAGRDGDGFKICKESFAPALAKNVEREAGQSCASEVEENLPEGKYELTVGNIEIQEGASATVDVKDEDGNASVLHFVRSAQDDAWEILRVTPAL